MTKVACLLLSAEVDDAVRLCPVKRAAFTRCDSAVPCPRDTTVVLDQATEQTRFCCGYRFSERAR